VEDRKDIPGVAPYMGIDYNYFTLIKLKDHGITFDPVGVSLSKRVIEDREKR